MIKIGSVNVLFDHHYNKEGQRVVKAQLFTTRNKFLAQGQATWSETKNYGKDKARREALKAAFNRDETLTKRRRRNFWEAYRTMPVVPRWPKKNA